MNAPAGYLHTSQLRVRYAETDQMGVVYHTHYLIWCEVGRTDLLRALGESYAQVEARGIFLAVADAHARYHGSARYDDLIEVRTRVDQVKSRTVTFAYEIFRLDPDPRRLVTATTMLIAIDSNGAPRTLPPDLLQRLNHALTSSL